MKPLPDKVGDAFAMLKHVSVLSVNIGIKGEAAYGRHWIYFPQKEIAFYRMGIASNFCHSLAPRGFSSLCFEISYPGGSILRRSSILGKILSGCRKAGFMLGEKDIEVLDMQDIEYAYCIYDQRRAAALKTISGYLAKYGIYLAGRYGGWQYLSMEDCMVQAKEIARKVGG